MTGMLTIRSISVNVMIDMGKVASLGIALIAIHQTVNTPTPAKANKTLLPPL